MRMLRTSPFSPQIGEKPYLEVLSRFRLWRDFLNNRVYLGVRTCELFLCFVAIVRVRLIMLTSLFSLFYVTGEFPQVLTPR